MLNSNAYAAPDSAYVQNPCTQHLLALLLDRSAFMQDYPEHRLQFFALLRAITNEVPTTLFQMSPEQLKLVIDSIVWAFRHTERNVAETGLKLLLEMLIIFDKSNVATQFYQQYYLQLIREIFAVMTGMSSTSYICSFFALSKALQEMCFKQELSTL